MTVNTQDYIQPVQFPKFYGLPKIHKIGTPQVYHVQ